MDSWGCKESATTERLYFTSPTPVFLGFPCGSAGKEFAGSAGDLGSIPGLGRSAGEQNGYPLQYLAWGMHGPCSPWGHKESDVTE